MSIDNGQPSITERSLLPHAGDALRVMGLHLPGAVFHADDDGWLALSGEPVVDMNYAWIGDTPGAVGRLRDYTAEITARGLPAIVLISAGAATQVLPVALELGLTAGGTAPVMALDAGSWQATALRNGAERFEIQRVTPDHDLSRIVEVMADAFALPVESAERFYSSEILTQPSLKLYAAFDDGEPVSTVTATFIGLVVGIWSMATAPHHQRRGAGRALLERVIADWIARGATTFYLFATPTGEPLYDRIGFRTVSDAAVWIVGDSDGGVRPLDTIVV